MMPLYDVHVYVVGRLTYLGVSAESMEEAIKKTDAEQSYARDIQYAEYAEEITGYLVDLEGDDDYSKSAAFDGEGRPQ